VSIHHTTPGALAAVGVYPDVDELAIVAFEVFGFFPHSRGGSEHGNHAPEAPQRLPELAAWGI
jgi:hypothetical protein